MRVQRLEVGPLAVNCYLLCEGGTALAVDPGGDAETIAKALKEQDLDLEAIVCTHGHFDHVGGCRGLMEATGADLLIHPADRQLLESAPEHAMAFGLQMAEQPSPTGLLHDGQLLHAGGAGFRVLHTPGHSPGGICLLGEGLLLSGDLLFAGSVGRTDLPGGSMDLLLRSVSRVLQGLDDEVRILPGHGQTTTVGRERRANPYLSGLGAGAGR